MGRRREIPIKSGQSGWCNKLENAGVQLKPDCDDNRCAGNGKNSEDLNLRRH